MGKTWVECRQVDRDQVVYQLEQYRADLSSRSAGWAHLDALSADAVALLAALDAALEVLEGPTETVKSPSAHIGVTR